MPPKNSSGKEKDLGEEDEVLQAVILADSFNKRFKPLTSGKPRCLLPVCNATLLDWTFESLALAGVQEIFVVCRSYPELVKAAIRDSKWSKPSLGLKIVPIITSKETFTPGDAMRDIYTRGIITSDFVLVMGDLVSNIRIDEVVRVHRERRRTNKDAIMTMVVKPSGVVHRTRSKGESGVFVLDAETSECLHYEHVTGYPPKKTARIPREIFAEHPGVEIRNDLMDCGIDVCSVEVPSLFQDNFDYGDIRRDFVHGVLTSDLLMKQIHCYVAREGYAARVADTRSYDSVSKDILARWTFPLVPDDNHPGGHSYEHLRGNKYIAKGNSVVLSRTCKISSNTLIGANTTIADNANIHASVIGQRCYIGPNVTLRNAYIFDDTHVGAGSVIDHSIIGSNAKIGESSTVARGCLVGDGVILGKQARLGEFDRVSKRKDENDEDGEDEDEEDEESEDSELEEAESRQGPVTAILGEGSNAVVWPNGPREDEDEEELDEVERFNNLRLMRIGDPATDLPLQDSDTDSDNESDSDSDSDTDSINALSRISSTTSASVSDAHHTHSHLTSSAIHSLQAAAAYSEFQAEVTQSLDRAFAEGHSVDNASVELKTLRMASNVPLRKVREAVVAAIVDRIEIVEGDAAKQRVAIGKMVQRWGPLIDRIGGVDPVETVEVLQYHCAQSARLPLFGQILAALYQTDIVDEDHIRAWHSRPEARGQGLKDASLAENVKRCYSVGSHMIKQFDEQESSEEESDEEDGGEESEDDEEPAPVTKAAPAPAASKKEESSEEEESEEESGSGEEDDSEEDESEDDPSVPKVPAASQSIQSPASSSAPKSAPPPAKGESESEENDSDEEEEESEDEPAAPVVSKTASEPVPSKPMVKVEESSEEDDDDDEEESEEAGTPSATQTKSAPAVASSRPPPTPASTTQVATSSSGHAIVEESSEDSEDSDDEPSQTIPKPPPTTQPASTSASSSKPPQSQPQVTKEESSESEESESEDDAASHVTAATAPVLLNAKSSSSETVRPPSTTASTTALGAPSTSSTNATTSTTSSIAAPSLDREPIAIPGPRPAFDGGSREVGSVGAAAGVRLRRPRQDQMQQDAEHQRQSAFRRHSIHFGDKVKTTFGEQTKQKLMIPTKRVVTMAGRQMKKGIQTILRRSETPKPEKERSIERVKEKYPSS